MELLIRICPKSIHQFMYVTTHECIVICISGRKFSVADRVSNLAPTQGPLSLPGPGRSSTVFRCSRHAAGLFGHTSVFHINTRCETTFTPHLRLHAAREPETVGAQSGASVGRRGSG